MYDVVIIGGGPAGIMCAIQAQKYNLKIALIEKNEILLKKFRLTGNGRCNILNMNDEQNFFNAVHNAKFLYSAWKKCNNQTLYKIFENYNIPIKIEAHYRAFPKSENANLTATQLISQLKNVDIFLNENVIDIENGFIIKTNLRVLYSKKVVVATGGMSFPQTGSSGDGYNFAKHFSHSITPLYPVESAIISNAEIIQSKQLQGISLKNCCISIYSNNKKVASYQHDLIFTHFGISGPASLGVSEHVYHSLQKNRPTFASLCLLENINFDEKTIYDSLKKYLPKRLVNILLTHCQIKEDTTTTSISKKKLNQLLQLITDFRFPLHDVKPIQHAFITGGGVNIKEVNPATFESKFIKNLYFIGEILDIHGKIGGYNLTYCFMSGYIVGNILKAE